MTDLVSHDINWARKITERLRLQATNYQEAREKVLATLAEARDGGAAELLGYTSWTAYMAEVFGDAPLRLERDARQELVAELAAEGMSTRAIAPIFGVSHTAVRKDIDAVGGNKFPPDPTLNVDTAGLTEVRKHHFLPQTMMRVNPDTGEVEDVPARHITGMDGKEYAVPIKPEPRKLNRRALTEVARDAGWDVRKAVERLERIREDDRYSRNKNEVAALMRGHLMYVIETCQGFLDDIDQNEEN